MMSLKTTTVDDLHAQLKDAADRREAAARNLDVVDAEIVALLSDRPALSSRAFASPDGSLERAELKAVNDRLLNLEDDKRGLTFDLGSADALMAELRERIAATDRAEQVAARNVHLAARDDLLAECRQMAVAVGAKLADAGAHHDAANRIGAALDLSSADWRRVVWPLEAQLFVSLDAERGRYLVDFNLVARLSPGEARRLLRDYAA